MYAFKQTAIMRLAPALSFCLVVLAGCAPVSQVATPGGRVGPVDEATVLGVWTYEVSGSCFLLRGDLYLTRSQGGLSGQLIEKPFPANVGPDPFETQADRRRCPQRARPATIILDEVAFDGRTLVFSGGSAARMSARFSLQGRATVNGEAMRGTLSISGQLGNVGRSEAARLRATRERDQGGQPYNTYGSGPPEPPCHPSSRLIIARDPLSSLSSDNFFERCDTELSPGMRIMGIAKKKISLEGCPMHQTKLFHHTSPRRMTAPTTPEPHHPLIEPSLFYDPPYERPLEDEFAWHLVKYLRPITGLRYQVKVETPCTNAWVDFVVEHGARRIGFEIGSPENPAENDGERYRDALVIGSGALDVLYRFRAADLLYRPHDALYLAAQWDRTLFSERGHINLHTLASPEARPCRPRPHETLARVTYEAPELEDDVEGEPFVWPQDVPPMLVVKRLSRANPSAWMRAYDKALAHFGVSDERLEQRWAKSA